MKTTEEILRENGFTDEQIKTLDSKAIAAFNTIAAEASEALRKADETNVTINKRWEEEYVPQINQVYSAVEAAKADAAYWKTIAEGAKANGFVVPETTPGGTPTATPAAPVVPGRDASGKFQPADQPRYMTQAEAYDALTNAMYITTEYQRLFGTPIPEDISTIVNEATARKIPTRQYAEEKYGFAKKREEIATAKTEAEINKRVDEKYKAREQELQEKYGSNPNLRPAVTSRFSNVREFNKDTSHPGSMTPAQRHAATRKYIQERHADAS